MLTGCLIEAVLEDSAFVEILRYSKTKRSGDKTFKDSLLLTVPKWRRHAAVEGSPRETSARRRGEGGLWARAVSWFA